MTKKKRILINSVTYTKEWMFLKWIGANIGFRPKIQISRLQREVIYVAKFESKDNELYIDSKKVLRGWESCNGWYWFATAKARDQQSILDDGREVPDTIYFGFAQVLKKNGDISLRQKLKA